MSEYTHVLISRCPGARAWYIWLKPKFWKHNRPWWRWCWYVWEALEHGLCLASGKTFTGFQAAKQANQAWHKHLGGGW